jgi:hypothetical protein
MKTRAIVTLAGLAALAGHAPAAPVVFFDGIFNNSDWSLTAFNNATGVGSTATGNQVLTGGNPNEYRRIRNNIAVQNPGNGALIGFHMNVLDFYTPSSQGAISTINYSEDSINFLPTQAGNGQGTGLAIYQNGKYYSLRSPTLVMPGATFSTWQPNNAPGTVASNYWEVTPTGNVLPGSNPDFSASGTIMQFGFWRGNSGNSSYQTDCGIDNWRLEIQQVPTPGSLGLLAAGGGLAMRRRRR